jgi:hypothetical protein
LVCIDYRFALGVAKGAAVSGLGLITARKWKFLSKRCDRLMAGV